MPKLDDAALYKHSLEIEPRGATAQDIYRH